MNCKKVNSHSSQIQQNQSNFTHAQNILYYLTEKIGNFLAQAQ